MNEQTVDNAQISGQMRPTPEIEAEFVVLMSLRLDGLLDDVERQRFEDYLVCYTALAAQWQEWQQLHRWFDCAPHMDPPANLAANVTRTLLQQARRRRLWQGLLFGAFVMTLWIGVAVAGIWLGALLLLNDGSWVSNLIHNLAFLSSISSHWWRTVSNLIASFGESPQAIGASLAYIALAAVMLSLWVRFLQRTTQGAAPIDGRTESVIVSP
jgi:hypothetical protein